MTPEKQLSIYFTAGMPRLEDTITIAKLIQSAGANMIEIGMPYSDPVADGPIIQKAHEKAIKNGMTIEKLFSQLEQIKETVTIPKILMGYINPVLQFGFENFCRRCVETGISGIILPDLPAIEFERTYREIVDRHGINFIFLITPETSNERIIYLDSLCSGFLYAVSSSSTTGSKTNSSETGEYLKRLGCLNLKNPIIVGFGIKNRADFINSTRYVAGGIIGSAFVEILQKNEDWQEKAADFVQSNHLGST